MHVLVTGGAGFIGSHLVDFLVAHGHSVTVLDNLSRGRMSNLDNALACGNVRVITEDLLDSNLEQLIADTQPEVIFHLAAQIDVRRSVAEPLFDAHTNIISTIRLAEAARKNNVRKIVFTSSGGSIYGKPEQFPVTENTPIATYIPQQRLPFFPKHGPIVVMSSGTTGTPKGVVRVEPVAPTVLAGILTKVPWRAGMRVQITASMFHAWGWAVFNIALGMRGTIVTHRIFDPERVFRDIDEGKLDGMLSSPIFLKDLVNLPDNDRYDCSSLKFIFSSGNALSPWLVEKMHDRFGKNLCNLYGSTEISAVAVASMEEIAQHPTTSGPICTGTDFIILDENDRPCPTGTPGRIFCYNTVTLRGYTDPNIPMTQYGHLIQIGDRGYLDENGFLFVLGRADDMIIVGGENVYPRSVEEVLEEMPGIADMYAGGVEDEDTFKRIAVWVVRSDDYAGQNLTTEAIQNWVLDRLAAHSVPRDVHFVDSLPRTATGKVMPRQLVPPQR